MTCCVLVFAAAVKPDPVPHSSSQPEYRQRLGITDVPSGKRSGRVSEDFLLAPASKVSSNGRKIESLLLIGFRLAPRPRSRA